MLIDIIQGVLPACQVSILAGASGAGKTTLVMQILKALQENQDVFGFAAQKNLNIAYLASDRSWDAYQTLAERVQVDTNKMQIITVVDDLSIDLELFEKNSRRLLYNLLDRFVKQGAELIVIDPLMALMGGDPNRYNSVAPRLTELNRYCSKNKVTVLGIHHAGKARTDFGFKRAQDRISGSSALLGFTSTQLFLAAAEEIQQEYCEWHIVPHTDKPSVLKLKRTDPFGLFAPYTMDDEIASASKNVAQTDLVLLDYLPEDGTPMIRREIVKAMQGVCSQATVDRLLKRLSDAGLIEQLPNGYYKLKTH